MFHYAEHMRLLRKEAGVRQKDIANILGVSARPYYSYEVGNVDFPISKLLILCNYYKVSADYLLGLSEKR